MKTLHEDFDVIVIGGGPAGMMAAGRASEFGARVLLLEKNQRLGIKLLITGNGRCNVTNNLTPREFIEEIGQNGKFLHSCLHVFGPKEMMGFLENRGLRLQIEESGRVFPKSNRSMDVLGTLARHLEEGKVTVRYGAEAVKFIKHGGKIESVMLADGQYLKARKFILTTGGKSLPETGSTGMGYVLAKSCGHRIIDLRPALSAINIKEAWIGELEGVSLSNAEAALREDGKLTVKKRGDLIFTATGISGPLSHDLSSHLRPGGELPIELIIDLLPQFQTNSLDEHLRKFFHEEGGRQLKNGLARLLPAKLALRVIIAAQVTGEKKQTEIAREERKRLVRALKSFELRVHSLGNFDKAYATAGGISLAETDPKTMKSKIVENLYFAGEILDLVGPTGGFNLQIAWSTGFAAGTAAAS